MHFIAFLSLFFLQVTTARCFVRVSFVIIPLACFLFVESFPITYFPYLYFIVGAPFLVACLFR